MGKCAYAGAGTGVDRASKEQQEEQHMSVEPSSEIPIYREEPATQCDKPLSETITSPLHEQPSTQSLESYIAETKENMTQAMTEKVSEEPKKPAKTSRTIVIVRISRTFNDKIREQYGARRKWRGFYL